MRKTLAIVILFAASNPGCSSKTGAAECSAFCSRSSAQCPAQAIGEGDCVDYCEAIVAGAKNDPCRNAYKAFLNCGSKAEFRCVSTVATPIGCDAESSAYTSACQTSQ